MSMLNNTTVNGVVTQTQPASQPNHLVRLAECQAIMASLFQGAWNGATTFVAGQMVTDNGALYAANQNTLNQRPSLNTPTIWRLVVAAGVDGASAFNYIAYASDASGTGFSLTPTSGLNYVAFRTSPTAISSPQASDFAGLWVKFTGADGAAGAAGATGAAGQSAYLYVGYASDTSGTGFSLTPGSGLSYVAFRSTTTPINTPSASDFTGLWKNYANPFTVTGPLTFSGGTLAINASSANTASYVVQRDASGNFSGGQISGTTFVVGGTSTLSIVSGALNVNTGIVTTALTLGTLSGVLKASAGVVAGSATTDDLTEGSTNQYFTQARVRATPLTGYTTAAGTPVILATDTVMAALGKLDAALVNGGNYAALAGATFTGAIVAPQATVTQAVQTSGSPNALVVTGAAHTTLAGGTEASDTVFNFARTVQFNTGTLTLQRASRIEAPTYAFVAASTLTTAVTLGISGAPVAGTNASITNAMAVKIAAGAVGSGTTNAYGLYVDAPTGATNNYCAAFNTGDVLLNAGWLKAATGYGVKVAGTQVLTNRQTGWTAATGTATRTSFATSSVTLPNLAQAVKALIDDLLTHGLIGA